MDTDVFLSLSETLRCKHNNFDQLDRHGETIRISSTDQNSTRSCVFEIGWVFQRSIVNIRKFLKKQIEIKSESLIKTDLCVPINSNPLTLKMCFTAGVLKTIVLQYTPRRSIMILISLFAFDEIIATLQYL